MSASGKCLILGLSYGDHGQKDETRRSSLFCTARSIDQVVHCRRVEDETGCEKADQLLNVSILPLCYRPSSDTTYRHLICLLGLGRNGKDDAADAEEHEHNRPPGEIRKGLVDIGNNGRDEGD